MGRQGTHRRYGFFPLSDNLLKLKDSEKFTVGIFTTDKNETT